MKYKRKLFRVGSKTYFHHKYGTVVKKNRFKLLVLNMTATVFVAGGFFVFVQFGLPYLKNNHYFQNSQQIATDNVVKPQDAPNQLAKAPIIEEDELLKSAIQEEISTFPGDQKWSVFVYDLAADRSVNINSDQEHDSASLYKLFLLEALEQKLPQDKWGYTYVDNKPIADCVQQMLQTGDDPCSEPLAKYIGWDTIDTYNHKNGYKNTNLAGLNGRNTTAADVGELLVRLKKGHILSDAARRFIFDALYQQSYSKGIAKGCKNCRVAAKTGELSTISHDAAVVTHGSKSYVVVIMSDGGSFDQIKDLSKIIDKYYYTDKDNLNI